MKWSSHINIHTYIYIIYMHVYNNPPWHAPVCWHMFDTFWIHQGNPHNPGRYHQHGGYALAMLVYRGVGFMYGWFGVWLFFLLIESSVMSYKSLIVRSVSWGDASCKGAVVGVVIALSFRFIQWKKLVDIREFNEKKHILTRWSKRESLNKMLKDCVGNMIKRSCW